MFNHATSSTLLIIVIIAIIVLRRRARGQSRAKHDLKRNQRAVYIQQQWLDPVIELLIVGGVVWNDLQHGWLPWLALLIGVVIGLPLGVLRGKFMYKGSLNEGSKVVLERNLTELGVFFVLVLIKIVAHAISAKPTSPINLVAVGLLGIGLASSVGRVYYITMRHYRSPGSVTDADAG